VNSTGAIEFEEFRRILHPILSWAMADYVL